MKLLKLLITFVALVSTANAQDDQALIKELNHSSYPGNILGFPTSATPAKAEYLKQWHEAKFGLFVHWGIYSVLEGKWKGEEIPALGEQIQMNAKIPGKEYVPIAKRFNPIKFDGRAYAKLAKDAGMTYIVLTSRHHDGFSMFETEYSDFDIMDATPYKKDIVKGFADGCKAEDIKFGLYYSNPDWHFNVDPNQDIFKVSSGAYTPEFLKFQQNQLTELLTNYGPIMEIFFDMGRPKLSDSKALAKTVRDLQPECLVSGRVMNNQGDFYTLGDNVEAKEVLDLPWEAPSTFHSRPRHTWGWKSWVVYPPIDEEVARCVQKLSRVTSLGGNFLLNIGPKPDGTVSDFQTNALKIIGEWVKKNRGSIFDVNTTPFKRSTWGAATWKENELYLHIADWPSDGKLIIPDLVSNVKEVHLYADNATKYTFNKRKEGGIEIIVPTISPDKYQTVMTVVCDSTIKAANPVVIQTETDKIVLGTETLIVKNFVHGMQYANTVKAVKTSWTMKPTVTGKYDIKLKVVVDKQKVKSGRTVDMSPRSVIIVIGNKLFRKKIPVTLGKAEFEIGVIELTAGVPVNVIIAKDPATFVVGKSGIKGFELNPIVPETMIFTKQ
ncbi:MAG: hypothetical protein GQ563_01000 [Desulfuromusa sp.]|nr:hypothetical protein [Desulfuromusa sp.]